MESKQSLSFCIDSCPALMSSFGRKIENNDEEETADERNTKTYMEAYHQATQLIDQMNNVSNRDFQNDLHEDMDGEDVDMTGNDDEENVNYDTIQASTPKSSQPTLQLDLLKENNAYLTQLSSHVFHTQVHPNCILSVVIVML